MPARALPRIGDAVTVAFLSVSVGAVVAEVGDGLQSVDVLTEEGDSFTFTLNPATGRYMAGGHQSGPRLLFDAR
jgi:hypothetical protein